MLTVPYENDSFMTDDAIKDNILLMMTASHDTSSTTIAFVLKYLYLNPECLKEVIRGQYIPQYEPIPMISNRSPKHWE